jgi:predicted nuclease with RNAse H fold
VAAICCVGVDVGIAALHAVAIVGDAACGETRGVRGHRPEVAGSCVAVGKGAKALDELVALCRSARVVAIDAPERQTTGCNLPGVRAARCAEVALAASAHGLAERIPGGPVSMLTPVLGAPFPPRLSWMRSGFSLWTALAARCPRATLVETYPSGSFKRMALAAQPAVRLVPRSTAAGVVQRLGLLGDRVALPVHAALWALDGVDALAAALAAYELTGERGAVVAEHTHPGHDGSRIVLVA